MAQPARTAATTRRGHASRLGGSRAVPRHPRRVSGPARPRAVAAPAVALPRGGSVATGVFERLRALPDHRMVDRLLRGRACIWVIGVLLGGIVAMQVSLLKMNAGISRGVEASSTLQRQNADLESAIARLDSGERVRAAAVKNGMVDPAAGDTRYLHARPGYDAAHAVRRMRPPSADAKAVMANGGRAAGALTVPSLAATAGTSAVTPATSSTSGTGVPPTTTTGTGSTTGVTATTGVTSSTTATPTATPVATVTPVPTATPVSTVTPAVG